MRKSVIFHVSLNLHQSMKEECRRRFAVSPAGDRRRSISVGFDRIRQNIASAVCADWRMPARFFNPKPAQAGVSSQVYIFTAAQVKFWAPISG